MANTDKPFGLRPVGNLSATGAQKSSGYQIADNFGTSIFQGDLVALAGGFIVKFVAASHATAIGVFNGCNYTDPTTGKYVWKNFYPASTNITTGVITADVFDDPSQQFLIQFDSTAMTQAMIGLNAAITTSTTGSTTTGVSASTLLGSSAAVTSTLALKICGLLASPSNDLGAYAVAVVKINTHQYGSVGVAGIA